MDEEKKRISPEQDSDTPGSVDKDAAAPDRTTSAEPPSSPTAATSRQKKNRVLIYLVLLFAFAFLLMLLSYVINQRNNSDAMSNLTESHRTFTESAVNSIAVLQDENVALREDRDRLADENETLTAQVAALEQQLTAAQQEAEALTRENDQLSQSLETAAADQAVALEVRTLICRGLRAMEAQEDGVVLAVLEQLALLGGAGETDPLSETALGADFQAAYRQLLDYAGRLN